MSFFVFALRRLDYLERDNLKISGGVFTRFTTLNMMLFNNFRRRLLNMPTGTTLSLILPGRMEFISNKKQSVVVLTVDGLSG